MKGLKLALKVILLTALTGAFLFSSAAAGLYSFGFTMIFRPMSLVTTAFSQVFSQRVIDSSLSSDTRINHGQKRGRHLHIPDSP